MGGDVAIEKIKLVNVTLVISLLLVLWKVFFDAIPYGFQIGLFLLSMLISGIPHGALDHIVQRESQRRENRLFNGTLFVIKYIALILIYALAWYFIPQLSLAVFVIMSCWHFGETDISTVSNFRFLTVVLRLIYGLCIIGWLLLTHRYYTTQILEHIIPVDSVLFKLWHSLTVSAQPFYLLTGILLILGLTVIMLPGRLRLIQLFQLSAIIISAYWLPLLPAFALYFAGWHSIITLLNIKVFISNNVIDKHPVKNLWLKALPFSIAAIISLLLTAVFLHYIFPLFNPLPLVFIFLSVITLPHMQVMHGLNSKLIA